MKRLVLLALVVAVLVSLGTAGAASAKRFATFASCGNLYHADAVCIGGDAPVAVFRAFRRTNVTYWLCVTDPAGVRRCVKSVTGGRGERSIVPIEITGVGAYTVVWRIGGAVVDRDRFRLKPETV